MNLLCSFIKNKPFLCKLAEDYLSPHTQAAAVLSLGGLLPIIRSMFPENQDQIERFINSKKARALNL